jgi:hypothetical protein
MEALGAQWREFDLAEKIWSVPASRMKTRKPHVVTLSDAAIAINFAASFKFEFPKLRMWLLRQSSCLQCRLLSGA